jgi:type II secretory pathway pseudopilin PulG
MQTRIKPGSQHRASCSDHEAGFMLVFVILLAALMLIALAVAAPVVAKDLRRDKEVESGHRANEYVRAIRLYYRKFKTYPPSIDALGNTNNVRFLRKQYIDPLTGKADWRIIHVGENKTTVKGFFGQPLGGLNTTGAGGGLGSASTLGTGFGGTPSSTSGPTSPTGTTPGSTGSTTVSGGSALSAGFSGATIGGSTPGSTTGSTTGSNSSSGPGGVGQIMGVGTAKTGDSIMNPNEQTSYETWEFLYDPKIELLYQQANILGGGAGGGVNSQPLSNMGTSPGQSNTPGGSNSNTPQPTAPQPTSPRYPQ